MRDLNSKWNKTRSALHRPEMAQSCKRVKRSSLRTRAIGVLHRPIKDSKPKSACLRVGIVMYANTAGFHNQEPSTNGLRLLKLQQIDCERFHQPQRRTLGKPQNHDPGGSVWREPQNIGEVDIHCQKASFLTYANLVECQVACAAQFFLVDGFAILARLQQDLDSSRTRNLLNMRRCCRVGPRTFRGSFRLRTRSQPKDPPA